MIGGGLRWAQVVREFQWGAKLGKAVALRGAFWESEGMRFCRVAVIGLGLVCTRLFGQALAPIPEEQQAALALKIIDGYHGPHAAASPKKLHLVYFTPADREAAPRYRERLEAILEDIRGFYRDGMRRAGFGPRTFELPRDGQGRLVFHVVKGAEAADGYPKADGDKVTRECRPALEAAGVSLKAETVLIFCHLGFWNEPAKTFRHHSPYAGSWSHTGGLCWAADWEFQDLSNIPKLKPKINDGEYGDMSLGKHATIFIGGIAHELGHALALPHCGERWDEKPLGTSLMGVGNHTYRNERREKTKGSFLAMASAMKLAGRPLFTGSDRGLFEAPQVKRVEFGLSTHVTGRSLAGRRGGLRVEGAVTGTPPIYGVVAYFDCRRDGGYTAPAATSVPDAEGRFAIEVSDLTGCENGELRLEFCHANGAASLRRAKFGVRADGMVDLSDWEMRRALEPLGQAVARGQSEAAQAQLLLIEKSEAPPLAKTIGRKLVESLAAQPKLEPALVPEATTELALGDAQPRVAEVGWLKPAANRVPTDGEIDLPMLDADRLYATGLYAHAPALHVFDLGGRWKWLRGEAGLHARQQAVGSVVFVIKTDGQEVFRSPVIRGASKASYKIDLTGTKTLELVVEEADNKNFNDWGLWLEPTLGRER